tara:strand:+ start:304 stop:483 length:180 start_codon:yes stop_codon:yes gene_type:complete
VHPLGKVFIENEAEDVIAKVIGAHFAAQGVGNVPELGLELLFVIFGHGILAYLKGLLSG